MLGGDAVEALFGEALPDGNAGAFKLYRAGRWLLGCARHPAGAVIEPAAGILYRDLFSAVGPRRLARIWNYVPGINQTGADGLETYRSFCRGRSLAFEERFGPGFTREVPAASAVGSEGGDLVIVFAAAEEDLVHVENPRQVPAYNYPADHGPRAPSFARATSVGQADQTRAVFISGTAAIRGHATVQADQALQELDCTLENLEEIGRACGLGPRLDGGAGAARHYKVYLRHAADFPPIERAVRERLLVAGDHVSFLRADICRAELRIEIEATLIGVRTGASTVVGA